MKEAGENFKFSETHSVPFTGRERWTTELEGLNQTAGFLERQLTAVNDRRDYIKSVLDKLDAINSGVDRAVTKGREYGLGATGAPLRNNSNGTGPI